MKLILAVLLILASVGGPVVLLLFLRSRLRRTAGSGVRSRISSHTRSKARHR